MIIANSALRASLAIYHLISNARSWNNCELYMSHQGTLVDALVIQAVADALNLNFELKFTSNLNKQPVNSILSTSLVILDLSKSHFKSYQL